jgi:hypothetical protein
MAENARHSWALLQPRLIKRITWIDPCPHCCELRELQATIYATEGDRRASTIECLTCHHTWPTGQAWLQLGHHTRRHKATA